MKKFFLVLVLAIFLLLPISANAGFFNGGVSASSGSGDMTKPASPTNGAPVCWDGTSGATKNCGSLTDAAIPTAGSLAASFQSGSGAITVTAGKKSAFVVCTNSCQVAPLTPAAGNMLCVMNDTGTTGVITLNGLGAGKYYSALDNASWLENYSYVSGGAATDIICIVGKDDTHYLVTRDSGMTATAP